MKRTWYTVQARAGADIATLPALTLAEARRAFREARAAKAERIAERIEVHGEGADAVGRRFPRIIRITLETKTIKEG
jgi:acyl-CoA reductase-like NAD-dependent aldehyde dehydrogenase